MKLPIIARLVTVLFVAIGASVASAATSYIGQEMRDIKSLSSDEINGYLSGKGMGLAKAAELNGYAGPAHVLELSAPLALTPEQRARTEALFSAMEAKASALGYALVAEERKLDQLFATKAVTADSLNNVLSEIGSLQAKIRAAHLEAHLAQVEILTPEQNARYAQLRGYGDAGVHSGQKGAHKH